MYHTDTSTSTVRTRCDCVLCTWSIQGGDTREHGAAADDRLTCDRQASANGESVPISVDFVPLTSPEAAETLYRVDEAAYTAACGRTHMLHTKKRKRQLGASVTSDHLAMAQHGGGMKLQVGGGGFETASSSIWYVHSLSWSIATWCWTWYH